MASRIIRVTEGAQSLSVAIKLSQKGLKLVSHCYEMLSEHRRSLLDGRYTIFIVELYWPIVLFLGNKSWRRETHRFPHGCTVTPKLYKL